MFYKNFMLKIYIHALIIIIFNIVLFLILIHIIYYNFSIYTFSELKEKHALENWKRHSIEWSKIEDYIAKKLHRVKILYYYFILFLLKFLYYYIFKKFAIQFFFIFTNYYCINIFIYK